MINPVQIDRKIEVNISGWVDISGDVVDEIACSYGIIGSSKIDRCADAGSMDFYLNNEDNRYTPGHPNCLPGFKRGIPVRLSILVSPDKRTKFYGHLVTIDPIINPYNRVKVTVRDYFDYLNNQSLDLTVITTNKTINDIVALILADMPVAPLSISYGTPSDQFSTIFDSVRDGTYAISEINKLVLSEWGWAYVRFGLPNADEQLVIEGRNSRSYGSRLTQIPKNDEYLVAENGNYLVTEDGKRIVLDLLQDTNFFDSMVDISSLPYDDSLINSVKITSYPRRIDSSAQVLWSMGSSSPQSIAAGASITMRCNYVDPSNKATEIDGMNMITPVATTDFLFNAASNGSGTNLTLSLTVTASFFSNYASLTLTNTSATLGYVTFLDF